MHMTDVLHSTVLFPEINFHVPCVGTKAAMFDKKTLIDLLSQTEFGKNELEVCQEQQGGMMI